MASFASFGSQGQLCTLFYLVLHCWFHRKKCLLGCTSRYFYQNCLAHPHLHRFVPLSKYYSCLASNRSVFICHSVSLLNRPLSRLLQITSVSPWFHIYSITRLSWKAIGTTDFNRQSLVSICHTYHHTWLHSSLDCNGYCHPLGFFLFKSVCLALQWYTRRCSAVPKAFETNQTLRHMS